MRSRVVSGSIPIISASDASSPGPAPNMTRPRVMWSSWMIRFATFSGWWYGNDTTPVPNLMCFVRSAAAANGKAVRGAGPLFTPLGLPRGADEPSQDEPAQDGIVGVADHRDEVGHQVDREREVDEEQPHQEPGGTGDRGIRREPAHQPD